MISHKVLFFFVLVFFLCPEPSAFAEIVCLDCHDTSENKYNQNVHGQLRIACMNCHGEARKHIKDPEQCDFIDLKDQSNLKVINSVCLSCHTKTQRLMFWEGSAHDSAEVSCTACHTVHTENAARMDYEKCYSCHRDVSRDVRKFSHHPIKEGKLDCASCHNQHGSLSEKLLKTQTVNELCYSCHMEKRGPFRFAHSPVEENCLTCHVPHGSNSARLTAQNNRTLCQSCHAFVQHRDLSATNVGPFSTGLVKRGSCLGCHGDIHGSNTDYHFR